MDTALAGTNSAVEGVSNVASKEVMKWAKGNFTFRERYPKFEVYPHTEWNRKMVSTGCCGCGPKVPKWDTSGTLTMSFRPGASDVEKIEQIYIAMTADLFSFTAIYAMS